ncbi:MAG: diacylglycerol kinase family protein [Clostridium sp.]|nr:diacylglycerol kinase family protein [Prevotella sp.]MCM1428301.1 diacylglycerol kinase family protein [Clostridium sp.]MCM1474773.1 diacylglycerol kinase family protein [Muribaculaceae bacterium]
MRKTERRFSWKARGLSFIYAWRGILSLVRQEHNAWIHVGASIGVMIAGIVFGLNHTEWCLVILCICGVLAAEGFNSAIEALADRITEEDDPLIGKAKDIAAGSVLLTALGAALIGLIIFLPKLQEIIVQQ